VTAAAPAKLVIASQPTTATAGSIVPAAVVVDVEDTFGNLAITDSSLVNMASSPSGKLGGLQIADSIGGVANFDDFDFTTAGSFSLRFTDGKLKPATSKKITVVFPPPTQVVFAAQPTTVAIGKKLSKIKVNVESATGIIVATDVSTVTLSIASGPAGAILGGTLTAKDIKGIASFSNLVLKTAGTYTLEATDGSLTSAVSASITVG
jgi:hypothetical protein